MNDMTQVQLLTPGQVAEALNVSHQTLWRWRQKHGTGPEYIRLGKRTVRYLPLKVASEQQELPCTKFLNTP